MVTNEGSLSSIPSLETDETPDFTVDDLTLLKEIFLTLEKVVDNLELKQGSETKNGAYIFEILGQANVSQPLRIELNCWRSLLKKKGHPISLVSFENPSKSR